VEKKDKLHADAQHVLTKPMTTSDNSSNSKDAKQISQSVTDCWNRRIVSWPVDSLEYKQRQKSLVRMMLYIGMMK
jgi:hypothetical protein